MANRIIVVSGPHEGVGKTTLAANLAARYAQTRRLPVILIDTDPLCRGEAGFVSGAASPMSAFQILDMLAGKQLSLPMLRGRVPLNRLNMGSITLAPTERDAEHINVEQWTFFLKAVSQIYDVVVDLEVSSPFKLASMDLADAVIWTFLPNALSLKATLQQMETLQSQKIGLQKFVFAMNQTGALPHGLTEDAINDALGRFDKELAVQLPSEPELLELLNQGRPSILDQSRSRYFQQMGRLVDILGALKKPAASMADNSSTDNGPSGPSGAAGKGNLSRMQNP